MKIGFFDSGVGGLTILRAVRTCMPAYDYLYYGDTRNVPYGNKTPEEIFKYTEDGIKELFRLGARVVVLACNTASVEALPLIQEKIHRTTYDTHRVLGVVIPTVEAIIDSGLSRVHGIATERTVCSKKYEAEFAQRQAPVALTLEATPELVPLIESGDIDAALASAYGHLDPKVGEVEGVMLGCTHYGILAKGLRKRYVGNMIIFSQDEIIPKKLDTYLERHLGIKNTLTQNGTTEIIWTGDTPKYAKFLN